MTIHEEIIIHPQRGKREKPVPENGLLLVTPAEMKYGQSLLMEQGGRQQFIYSSNLFISSDNAMFAAGPAIGAPVAAMTLEKLIALGGKKIIMFGWCGAVDSDLKVGDVVIGALPVSGEGTSAYYLTGSPVLPSDHLVCGLSTMLAEAGIAHSKRNVWSTDAPYREDRIYLEKLHDNADVCCVDMEYSALCAVAAFRGVEFAALFVVSDELYQQQWKAGYTRADFKATSKELIQLLIETRF